MEGFDQTLSTSHLEFLAKIAPWRDAYERAVVTYVAVRIGGNWAIAYARIDLAVSWAKPIDDKSFESINVRARRFHIGGPVPDWKNWEILLDSISNGALVTPDGELPLYKEDLDSITGASWIPANDQWRRDVVYHVHTNSRSPLANNPELDWELKSASTPYDGVADLVDDFGLNPQQLKDSRIEVLAWHVAEIDMASDVGDTDARLACLVASRVDHAAVALNYRVRLNGMTVVRGSLHGDNLVWEQRENMQRAVGRIEIPNGAIIQCFANVTGHAHHQYWVANPRALPNPTRAAFEHFDQGLQTLRDFLFDTGRRGRDARDLEFGISWLLWMHGFSPATFGPNKRTQEAPDILATSPNGHFLVVACTTGGLKADHKLSRLHERSSSLRRRLNEAGHSHVRLISVIVTPLPREEVMADIEQAERLGILVVTREDIERAITESFVLPNAEREFANAEKTAQDNQRQHQEEPKS